MRATYRNRSSGFTLLEVMIALIIVALSLTMTMTAISGYLNNANILRDRTYASWIAQNRIVEIRLSGVVPEVGVTSGDIEYANRIWDWEARINETGVVNLLRIDVDIMVEGSDEPVWTTTGFVGEPVPFGQANRAWSTRMRGRGDDR